MNDINAIENLIDTIADCKSMFPGESPAILSGRAVDTGDLDVRTVNLPDGFKMKRRRKTATDDARLDGLLAH